MIVILLLSVSRQTAEAASPFRLIAPVDGITMTNNMPTLSWFPETCQYYEVWIDQVLMDTVRADRHTCVPFPLSFGEHHWKVIAVNGDKKIESNPGSFEIDDRPLSELPAHARLLRYHWQMKSSVFAGTDGAKLSSPGAETKNWYPTTIPVTVLSVLVRNGVYPNPYTGLNNMRIPDSNDAYNHEYDLMKYSHIPRKNPWKDPYWFRTSFELQQKDIQGKMVWLNFNEINYRAEIWLNGKLIADTATVVGMERSFRFNVTPVIHPQGKNYLAVAIYPVDVPGEPGKEPLTALGEPGTNMGDGMISKNYTKWDVLGWDWQPAVRDRDMGITEDVFISVTDPIELKNLYVTTDLPLPDTTSANVVISADVVNHSAQAKKGTIKTTISIDHNPFTFEEPFSVGPNETRSVTWDPGSVSRLHLTNPKLWWPAGYGQQNLYDLRLEATAADGEHAEADTKFGVREVETYVGCPERVYKVNGQQIYLKGGNWVIDMMLNWNAERYTDEILLTKNAGLNILRIWGPTGVPPEAFYEAADQHGILIWQDFLNDFWGTFQNTPGYCPDKTLFEKATTAIVEKYRNHPSLVIWCGGNEGPNPRETLITGQILPHHDGRDSRHYLKASNGDGLHGGGPYNTIRPQDYFGNSKLTGLSSEIGPSGVPVYESVRKFMPDPGDHWLAGRFPLDDVWAYHDANDWPGADSRKFSSYDDIVRHDYGGVHSTDDPGIREYLHKCQLINYDVYRAAIESINRQLWSTSSGILLWKSNSSWPSMVWQVYDWYMQAHAGFYGTKHAAEAVHIQLNRDSMDVIVLNTKYQDLQHVRILAEMDDVHLRNIWHRDSIVHLPENQVTKTNWIVPRTKELSFLRLQAINEAGQTLSDNLYWLSSSDDYTALNQLAPAKLSGSVLMVKGTGKTKYILNLTNTGDQLAFMVSLKLVGEDSGAELLPSFWSDNYIHLFPGESARLEVKINDQDLTEDPVIQCEAFNMKNPLRLKPKKEQ